MTNEDEIVHAQSFSPEADLKAAVLLLLRHFLEDGLEAGGAGGIMIPACEIDGDAVGPFMLNVTYIDNPPPGEASVVACLRMSGLAPEARAEQLSDNCRMCGEEVAFSPQMPKEVHGLPKVCMDCLALHGPDEVEALMARRAN